MAPSPTPPTMGSSYWEQRRAQWISGTGPYEITGPSPARAEASAHPGSSRAKLENLLATPGAEESEELWRSYLGNIHKNLVEGTRLRKPLKLSLVVSGIGLRPA